MKRLFGALGLAAVALASSAVAEILQQFTVTGELIPYISTDVRDRNVQATKDFDWSTAKNVLFLQLLDW